MGAQLHRGRVSFAAEQQRVFVRKTVDGPLMMRRHPYLTVVVEVFAKKANEMLHFRESQVVIRLVPENKKIVV